MLALKSDNPFPLYAQANEWKDFRSKGWELKPNKIITEIVKQYLFCKIFFYKSELILTLKSVKK